MSCKVVKTEVEKRDLLIFTWIALVFDVVYFLVISVYIKPLGPVIPNDPLQRHFTFWRFIYLTFWGGITQIVYFTTSLLYQYKYQHGEQEPRLRKHLDRFFTLFFLLGIFIGIVFWTVIWPSAETKHKIELNGFWLQFSLDFGAHGMTVLAALMESILTFHSYRSWKIELALIFGFAFLYCGWQILVYYVDGSFPYGFENSLSLEKFAFMLIGFVVGILFIYWIQQKFVYWWWKDRMFYCIFFL